jgi:hypothetical protein
MKIFDFLHTFKCWKTLIYELYKLIKTASL